jgi:uncharacterized protein (DUF433 family)
MVWRGVSGVRRGRVPLPGIRGSAIVSGRRQLTRDQVVAIATAHAAGGNARALAAAYGVDKTTIHAAVAELRQGRLRPAIRVRRRSDKLAIPAHLAEAKRDSLSRLSRDELEARYGQLRGTERRTLLSDAALIDVVVWLEILPGHLGGFA